MGLFVQYTFFYSVLFCKRWEPFLPNVVVTFTLTSTPVNPCSGVTLFLCMKGECLLMTQGDKISVDVMTATVLFNDTLSLVLLNYFSTTTYIFVKYLRLDSWCEDRSSTIQNITGYQSNENDRSRFTRGKQLNHSSNYDISMGTI